MQVELKNTTKKLCVIGDPVLHSKSPVIQNTMIRTLGLDYLYLCQPVARGTCREWLECAEFAGYAGFNATMPHKQELVPLMDALDEDARMYGAVNTVVLRDGKRYGYNTDGRGFLAALGQAGVATEGRTVLVLGAGGAAKAVAPKLCQAGRAERVIVANRTVEKAEALCAAHGDGRMVPAAFDQETLSRLASEADLVVNCTNLGMTGTAGQFESFGFLDALKDGAAVCDLIYAPAETELLRQARLRGHLGLNGLGMLIWQAVFALEHFTGESIDGGAVLPAVEAALAACG
ncbi:shikimate dehydrogenase [Pseudoflavonifractor sp. MSJ-37]|uniref:shikimate dehydrogenase n=1 Tax=Pseudoflavonifractor sp. MSJ-37 TaxID=2841531 RepID=UPI001C116958|nr:shikimate dehydrogenase [Pseudoflavonifractor sp. MSJ-37]MBU5436262.1 shikimate dehydrogenase [Pseudoflavonifractor sp. MSJ-37]